MRKTDLEEDYLTTCYYYAVSCILFSQTILHAKRLKFHKIKNLRTFRHTNISTYTVFRSEVCFRFVWGQIIGI